MFTKDKTQLVKGLAVLMMIVHHMWAFPLRCPDYDISHGLAQVGTMLKVCVAIFLFLSGYGLMTSANKHPLTALATVNRTKNLILSAWKVWFLFMPVGQFLTNRGGVIDYQQVIQSLFLVRFDLFNAEWWFLATYIELLILFFFIEKIKKGYWLLSILLGGVGFICSAFINQSISYFHSHLYFLAYYSTPFLLGSIVARYKLYERLSQWLPKNICRQILLATCIVICLLVRLKWGLNIFTFLMVPAFVLLLSSFKIPQVIAQPLMTMGKYSMNMWLIHPFFCYYFFYDALLFISAGNIYLATIELIVISLILAWVVDMFWTVTTKCLAMLKQNQKSL